MKIDFLNGVNGLSSVELLLCENFTTLSEIEAKYCRDRLYSVPPKNSLHIQSSAKIASVL